MLKKSRQRRQTRLAQSLGVLCNALDALHEALTAHRRYERLTSRGVPHDIALRQALGIDPAACGCRTADGGRSAAPEQAFLARRRGEHRVLSYVG
jgi:hypothetical protein